MNTLKLQKTAIALALLIAVGSFGFAQAYGYGSTGTRVKLVQVCHNGKTINVLKSRVKTYLSQGDTEGRCQLGMLPTVSANLFTPRVNNQYLQAYATSITIGTIMSGIESGEKSGKISDTEAASFRYQLSSILNILMGMFK